MGGVRLERRPSRDNQRLTIFVGVSGELYPEEHTPAFAVRRPVKAQPATLNRIHAFGAKADAERHADRFRGAVLAGSERPFQNER